MSEGNGDKSSEQRQLVVREHTIQEFEVVKRW
jgi:hypothetical protein